MKEPHLESQRSSAVVDTRLKYADENALHGKHSRQAPYNIHQDSRNSKDKRYV